MYELKITAGKVLGTCTADPPVKRGDFFTVRDGDITIPEGGFICLWALQSLVPLITPKEREVAEEKHDDWLWRVHHAQCPDPNGRVVFKIERVKTLDKAALERERMENAPMPAKANVGRDFPGLSEVTEGGEVEDSPAVGDGASAPSRQATPRPLRVVVEQVKGKCTSHMAPGDYFILRSGRIYIPAGRHFCLYALQAVLPLLPAKQRAPLDGDWLASDDRVICPDPAGNVIMRIEPFQEA